MTDRATDPAEETLPPVAPTGLAVCPLLQDIPPEGLRELERKCQWQRLPAGELVVQHGAPPDEVFFIISGRIRIFYRMNGQQEVNFAQLGPGDVFGEVAAIDGLGRSADAVTEVESVLASCEGAVFRQTLLDHPRFALGVLTKFAGIIRRADQQIRRLAGLTGVQRVYLELLRLAIPDASGDGTWIISPAPLHKEIAGWAGTSTDIVGRALGHLMKANLLQRRGARLQIIDRERIEALAAVTSNPPN